MEAYILPPDTMKLMPKEEGSRSVAVPFLKLLCPKYRVSSSIGITFKPRRQSKATAVTCITSAFSSTPLTNLSRKVPIPARSLSLLLVYGSWGEHYHLKQQNFFQHKIYVYQISRKQYFPLLFQTSVFLNSYKEAEILEVQSKIYDGTFISDGCLNLGRPWNVVVSVIGLVVRKSESQRIIQKRNSKAIASFQMDGVLRICYAFVEGHKACFPYVQCNANGH